MAGYVPTFQGGSTPGNPSQQPAGQAQYPAKPMPIASGGYQNPSLQRRAQSNLPYTPRNGNPRGAHNTPQRQRSSQTAQYQALLNSIAGLGGGQRMSRETPTMGRTMPGWIGGGTAPDPRDMRDSDVYNAAQGYNFDPYTGGSRQNQGGGYPIPPQNIYRGGQNPMLGRYRPQQMVNGQWGDQDIGGYSYNLPNAFGPYPQYGQGQYGYGQGYPMPQWPWGG